MALIQSFWKPGDILSAEKLNQHLQKSQVFMIKTETENGITYLNKTAEQLIQLLDQRYILYCQDYGFLYQFYKQNEIYSFRFYEENNIKEFSINTLNQRPESNDSIVV